MCPADLLLLDEPTNHLDLDATLWLETWLKQFQGTLLLIAHDREFLDAVADHIIHLHRGQAETYRGNYSDFETQRAAVLSQKEAAFQRQQTEIRHMESFIERFRAKASKARQAQSRLKALERMRAVAPTYADSPYHVTFTSPSKMSNPLLSLQDLTVGYRGQKVLSGINQTLLPGDRIGVLGANGAGKTTLLKSLTGELPVLEGTLVRGEHAEIGYFAQHQLETLRADATPLQTLAAAVPEAREQWTRDYLGTWGFSGELAVRPCRRLSGGERARLALALIACGGPAILILDEPTNHLDLDMREALALALQDYSGALLLVSHDRSLLKRTVDEFWLVEDGQLTPYDGDLDGYTARRRGETGTKAARHERRTERRATAEQRERERPLRNRVRALEGEVDLLSQELKALECLLADPEIYQRMPPEELDDTLARSGKLRKRLIDAEESWLQAAEALEALLSR
jgi:ATP-binding cassette subfamily F protein 3